MSLQEIRQQAYNELDKLGYTKLFDNRPKDAIPPIWEDLWFLYQKVRERNPTSIIEYGSGCSTIIISQAIIDRKTPFLSIESEEDWWNKTKNSMPETLKDVPHWCCGPTKELEWFGKKCFSYLPWTYEDIGFMYVDGPELTDDIKITSNPITLEKFFNNDFYMVVDGRPETVNFLEKHLKGKYDIQRNYEENRTTFERIG